MQTEKIFANHTYGKELIFKIYEQLIQLCKKNATWFFSMVKKLEQIYLQRRYTEAKRYMKKYSTSPIIQEIQIKNTMNFCLTFIRMTIIKKTKINPCCQECEEI